MKVVAAIACRNNSRRLFGKPLQLLQDYTVIDYIINNLKERDEIDAIVLAISDAVGNEMFMDLAEKQNINYVIELFHYKQQNSNNLVYIETIIKRLFKTECNFANVKNKLQHPEFDEKQDNMSLNKFIKWLFE